MSPSLPDLLMGSLITFYSTSQNIVEAQKATTGTLVVKLVFLNSSNLMASLNVSVCDHEISRSKKRSDCDFC